MVVCSFLDHFVRVVTSMGILQFGKSSLVLCESLRVQPARLGQPHGCGTVSWQLTCFCVRFLSMWALLNLCTSPACVRTAPVPSAPGAVRGNGTSPVDALKSEPQLGLLVFGPRGGPRGGPRPGCEATAQESQCLEVICWTTVRPTF